MRFLDSIIAVRMNELKASPIYTEKSTVQEQNLHNLKKTQSKKVALPLN